MSSNSDRVPFELSKDEADKQFNSMFAEALDFYTGIRDHDAELISDAKSDERDRIRTELIDWLTVSPTHSTPGSINGRRIMDEIDRICPKE